MSIEYILLWILLIIQYDMELVYNKFLMEHQLYLLISLDCCLDFLKTLFWCQGQILIVKCRFSACIFNIQATRTSITHNMINHPFPIIYSSFDNFCSYMTSKFTMWFLFLGDKIAITVTISHRVVVNSFCLFFAL